MAGMATAMMDQREFMKLKKEECWEAYRALGGQIESLLAKDDATQKTLKSLERRLETLEKFDNFFDKMEEWEEEKTQRAEKKNNVVIYGVPEVEGGNSPEIDKNIITDILLKSGITEPFFEVVAEHFRMGKEGKKLIRDGSTVNCPRLIKLKLKTHNHKRKIITSQRKALPQVPAMQGQPYSQYIRDDLTARQRKHYFDLKVERDKRNASDSTVKWKIFDGKLRKVQEN